MRSGTAASGENPGDAHRIQTRNVGRANFVHHQNVRLLRLARGLHATQLRQHTTTNVAQIRRALGEQGVLQRFLLLGGGFDHRHPRRFGALALLEAGVDFVGQIRIVEHFLVGDENLANGFGLAAFDQALNVCAHVAQRLRQALTFDGGRLAAQRVINGLLHLNMRRADGNARCCRDRLQQAARGRGDQHFGNVGHHFTLLTDSRQWLDFFTEAFFNGGEQRRQSIGSDARLGDQLKHLTTPGAEAEQFAQTFDRHRAVLAVDDAHTDFAVETLRQLREDFCRPRMQTVGVGQRNTRARPVGRQLTTKYFEDFTAAGGTAQLMTATFDQQRTQALKQRLMRFAEAGQTEQAAEWLAEVAHRFVRGDERQARALHGLLAVQPPQTIAERQRFDLLQHAGKTVADAIGLTQQTRATPDQFFEIVGRNAEADHLRIQRQLLRRALQQLQQCFRRAGTTQGLAQVGFAEGAGQQLQQAQVLVGFGRDADRQIDNLPIAPIDALGKLHQAHAGGEHLIAGFRGAVRNGNTLAEKGRALGFPGLQAGEIAIGDQAIGNQMIGQNLQGGGFIHGRLAHGYLLYSELEHAISFLAGYRPGIVLMVTA